MPIAPSNGIQLYYETHGDPSDPALLLVNGYSSQILFWGEGYREAIAARGRYVISFDNRDVGLSTHFDGVTVDLDAIMAAAVAGVAMPPVPYTLDDFAADAVGLLDHLGIARAHIAGSSMGGMIVQTIAINYPDRVLTMTSVMSTTGEPDYFQASPEAAASLTNAALVPTTREEFIADATKRSALGSGRRYFDPIEISAKYAASFDRMFYPEGWTRQMAGIRASGQRVDKLRQLKVPTLVIHGMEDGLITAKGGIRTAEIIPGANLLLLHDMGHDLPRPLWPLIIDAIISHTSNAIG
jgi:pimeloyl-ACP methyl ester carboxylesterase